MLVVGSRTGFTIRQAYFLNQGRLQRNHVQGGFIRTTTYIHTQFVLINVHTANQPGMQKGEYNRHIINLIIGHGHASGPEKIVQALVLVQAKQSYTRSCQTKGCLNVARDEECTARTRSSQIKGCLNVGMKVQALVLVQAKQSYTRSSQIKVVWTNGLTQSINYIHAQMMIYSSFYFIIHHCKNILVPALMVFHSHCLPIRGWMRSIHSHHCFNCPSITFRWQICLNKHQVWMPVESSLLHPLESTHTPCRSYHTLYNTNVQSYIHDPLDRQKR